MRKTKIICTLGPASDSKEVIRSLIETGLDVARLNFSHGSYEEHGLRISRIREVAAEIGKFVGIMLDIKGPKIRTGKILGGQVELTDGQEMILTADLLDVGTADRISISYAGLVEDVYPGAPIRIDDGLIGLEVVRVVGRDIHCVVTNGGVLKDNKGINAPGVKLRIPSVTEKDIADIHFGIDQQIDLIAASFVRKGEDIVEVRRILEQRQYHADIIAKIETQEGLENLDEIVAVADGVMVARGDLGVEIATEDVPLAQKRMIRLCNRIGKPVITATQMLDSMQRNPRPTRAEATDVANAIFDGTDAIMLSGETAAGRYPIEAVRTMAQIAERAERAVFKHEVAFAIPEAPSEITVTDVIGHAAKAMTQELGVQAIIATTSSGYTARMIAKHRPATPIIAATPNPRVARQLMVTWGVSPVLVEVSRTTDEVLDSSVEAALGANLVQHGDMVVMIAGVPVGQSGTTNLLKIHTIADALASGIGIGQRPASGRIVVGLTAADILRQLEKGDIIVTRSTDADMMPAIELAGAIITEEGGLTSHAAIVGLSLGKPVIVGVNGALKQFRTGQIATIDPVRGIVYRGSAHVL